MATADDRVDALGYNIAAIWDRQFLQRLYNPLTMQYETPNWQIEFERRIQC